MVSSQSKTTENSGSPSQYKASQETRERISQGRKKWWEKVKNDPQQYAIMKSKLSEGMKKVWNRYDQNGVRIRKSHKHTQETKKKISETHKLRWKKIKEEREKFKD